MTPKLVIFDVDDTLAPRDSIELLPGVREYFDSLPGDLYRPIVALTTNQGGVGMRCMLEQDGRPDAAKYPTQEEVERRLAKLAAALGVPYSRIYVSFAFKNAWGTWTPTPVSGIGDPRWSRAWRKPNPGMLRQAMSDAGAGPAETIMVGDREEDERAARAAGVTFIHAEAFFRARVPA
ncbi:MAG: HAD-IIIA family hydrolase [Chloroflexi bacterium]|nr:HAD-IIIA family hydrolase [Chloroflexota bacterium]